MDELPIDHRPQAVGTDDEVPEAQVTVHDRRLRGRRRPVRRQPLVVSLEGRAPVVDELVGRPVRLERVVGGEPWTSPGSIECSPPRNAPICRVSTDRASASSGSRRIRLAIVSPGTRAITRPAVPRSPPPSSTSTAGTGRPARCAARIALASRAIEPGAPGRPGGSRRRTSSRSPAENDHVSREAPPESGSRFEMAAEPRTGSSVAAICSDTGAGSDGLFIGDRRVPTVRGGPAGRRARGE